MEKFQLSRVQNFTISITKAKDVLKRLKSYKTETEKFLRGDVSFTKQSAFDYERHQPHHFKINYSEIDLNKEGDFKSKITAEAENRARMIQRSFEILEDLASLENLILYFEIKSKIHEKKSFISNSREKIKVYESLNLVDERIESDIEVIAEKFSSRKYDKNSEGINVDFMYWDKKHISQTLFSLKNTILEYEEDIIQKLTSSSLQISLHETSVELVGLT
jgi:hypothetical protein